MLKKGAKILLTLVFFILGVLQAEPEKNILKIAEELEKEKKFEQACALYEEWLKTNSQDPRFSAVLFHCAALKKNPKVVISLFLEYAPKIKDPLLRSEAYKQAAILALLCARTAEAYNCFLKAFTESNSFNPEEVWLIKTISLALALGEVDRAYELIGKFDPFIKSKDGRGELNYLLLAIYLLKSDLKNADFAWQILKEKFSETKAFRKAIFLLLNDSRFKKDKTKSEFYYQALKDNYPSSLERYIAEKYFTEKTNFEISFLITPIELLGYSESAKLKLDSAPSQSEALAQENKSLEKSKAQPEKRFFAIQVGSFTVRENAEYLLRDLIRLSFSAQIVEVAIHNKIYYRVLVGKELNEKNAQTMLAKLRDKGIDGWLVNSP